MSATATKRARSTVSLPAVLEQRIAALARRIRADGDAVIIMDRRTPNFRCVWTAEGQVEITLFACDSEREYKTVRAAVNEELKRQLAAPSEGR